MACQMGRADIDCLDHDPFVAYTVLAQPMPDPLGPAICRLVTLFGRRPPWPRSTPDRRCRP